MTDQSLRSKRMAILTPDAQEVFWSRVDRSGGPTACWPWTFSIDKQSGYGQLNWIALGGVRKTHAVAWELANGREVPIDPDSGIKLDVDHNCHNKALDCSGGRECPHRRCCNPLHLEPKRRAQHHDSTDYLKKQGIFRESCTYEHEFTQENTLWTIRSKPRSGRTKIRPPEKRCRICEYSKNCRDLNCQRDNHDHVNTPWPAGNTAIAIVERFKKQQQESQ
jgi:hypothetical protein